MNLGISNLILEKLSLCITLSSLSDIFQGQMTFNLFIKNTFLETYIISDELLYNTLFIALLINFSLINLFDGVFIVWYFSKLNDF